MVRPSRNSTVVVSAHHQGEARRLRAKANPRRRAGSDPARPPRRYPDRSGAAAGAPWWPPAARAESPANRPLRRRLPPPRGGHRSSPRAARRPAPCGRPAPAVPVRRRCWYHPGWRRAWPPRRLARPSHASTRCCRAARWPDSPASAGPAQDRSAGAAGRATRSREQRRQDGRAENQADHASSTRPRRQRASWRGAPPFRRGYSAMALPATCW